MALHVQEGNLDEFINKILEAFRDLINQKKIRLEYDSDKIQDPIWFDHEKLENVLYNLLSNAFKYTPDYGTVNIRVRFTDQLKLEGHHDETRKNGKLKYVQIGIADTGIGIKKEKLPNIFKRFYQADEKSDGTMGSGIGLSLTRDLVKIHRGHIEVESEVGKGTRFTIHLPCDRKAFSEEEITEAKFGATSLKGHVEMLKDILASDRKKENEQTSLKLVKHMGKPTLLIVEDNSELKEFIARRLNHEFNILMAENGEVGFDLAIAHNPDLIISDIMMPVLDGLELCRLLKQKIDTSHIPVIMLTAKDSVENKIEGFKTGADDYIPKPFNIELLETRVKNLIESRTRLRKIFASRSNLVPEELTENPMDQKFIRDALEHIERNIDNTEFNVNDFAAVMCVSRSLLHKKLTALTDQSATDFINTVRLKKSRELILSGVYNISEVAYAVGYNDPKYFSRLFKKQFGIAPSEFLREIRSKAV